MDPNSSLGKICLGEDVVVISSDKVEGYGDLNSSEFQATANSGQKKETKAMVFYQIHTEEVSDRFVALCFVNGLEAYDGEINLGVEENMISNEYAVKLCMEHEVKRGNKVVKKELTVALRGEIYFVKFIINPEDDDVEHEVILGRSFIRMTKAITDFGAGTVTIYPDIDPFLEETEEEEKRNDDWDHLLDFNIDDIQKKHIRFENEGLKKFMVGQAVNNSLFKSFFEKEKLSGPNFIDWYRNLRIVLMDEDKLTYLENPIPVSLVPAPPQQIPPNVLTAHIDWVKASKFIHNYNIHGMGKTVNELHVMLKLHEQSLPKKYATPSVMAIKAGRI
ncbi:hypothetical protein Tco_0577989 [Tanacetum coccineum]